MKYTDNGDVADRPRTDDDDLKEAKDRLDDCWQYDKENREQAGIDLRFLGLDQWPESIRTQREQQNRPCLTLDHLNQYKNQVVNDIRQAKIGIKAIADDINTEDERAEIVTSLMRDIQYKSHASYVYANAADGAVSCGIGHFRIEQRYARDDSFDQELRLKAIPYPLAVYWDPAAVLPDRSDAEFCFIVEFIPMGTFKSKWKKAKPVSIDTPTDSNQGGLMWATEDGVLVGEYYRKKYSKTTIAALEDGTSLDITGLSEDELAFIGPILNKRTSEKCTIEHGLMTGAEFLEPMEEVAGKYIPVIPVIGTEIHLEKKRVRYGLVRPARDAQQLYNYWRSAAAELIALAPKSKWLVTAKQIGARKAEWDTAHADPKPYLVYNPDSKAPGVAPQLISPPAPPAAIWQEAALVVDDMKAATGIYDASLGAKSNETSGTAIQRRQSEGDTSTFHFMNNLERSLEHLGTVLLDLIPLIYDNQRQVRLMDDKDEYSYKPINTPIMDIDGSPAMLNDLSQGKFAVRVSIGPNFTTQRIEAADGMLKYAQADPEALPLYRDLFVKAMDWPNADEIAERLKKQIPQEVLSQEEKQTIEQPPVDPMVQQANQLALQKAEADVQKALAEAKRAEADAMLKMAQAQQPQGQAAPVEQEDPQLKQIELQKAVADLQKAQLEVKRMEAQADKAMVDANVAHQQAEMGLFMQEHQESTASNQKGLMDAMGKQGEGMLSAVEQIGQGIAMQGKSLETAFGQIGQAIASIGPAVSEAVREIKSDTSVQDGLMQTNQNMGAMLEAVAQSGDRMGSLGEAILEAAKQSGKPRRNRIVRDERGNAIESISSIDDGD
jgi:hypothetical protein